MDTLQCCNKAGLKQDTDLQPLRSRPDFTRFLQTVLEDVEKEVICVHGGSGNAFHNSWRADKKLLDRSSRLAQNGAILRQ